MNKVALELIDIDKRFGGVLALSKAKIKINKGEVHALIGENGAGKSTLVKIICGIYRPDSGKIILNGNEMKFSSPIHSQESGIAVIHQETSVFPELSVLENIFMGHFQKQKYSNLIDWKGMKQKALELFKNMEIEIDPEKKLKDLSTAERHMIEIIKALSYNAQIIIMDEPSSALTLKEVNDLYKIIRKLKSEGKSIIYISHKFDEIFEIADTYTVLRDGRYIGDGIVKESKIDDIITMMVGRNIDTLFPKENIQIGNEILRVENLSKDGVFEDISFNLHKGEILGFFGLVGSGRSEIMRTIFGIDRLNSGNIFLNNKRIQIKSPCMALNNNIALVPEDRKEEGIILKMAIDKNISLPLIDKISKFFITLKKIEEKITLKYSKPLDVKCKKITDNVDTLSGGNQQKIVLAKWLATNPSILILDEPTKGIDVGTKATVHKLMNDLAKEGIAIILVSSELPEVIGMSDRIIVINEGKIIRSFDRNEANPEDIILAATGHRKSKELKDI